MMLKIKASKIPLKKKIAHHLSSIHVERSKKVIIKSVSIFKSGKGCCSLQIDIWLIKLKIVLLFLRKGVKLQQNPNKKKIELYVELTLQHIFHLFIGIETCD